MSISISTGLSPSLAVSHPPISGGILLISQCWTRVFIKFPPACF